MPLKQRISDAEAEIARINGIIAKIDTALALPDLFKRDPKQAAQLSKARAGAASALQRAEEEWLAASSQYDEGHRLSQTQALIRTVGADDQVAAGFFLALDFAALGGAACSGPRSIDVRRPAVKV